jgi:hypothetical protein
MSAHILFDKAFTFPQEKTGRDPEGCFYDPIKGAWMREEKGKLIALVRSCDSSKPVAGTKKCDVETGEDVKGE